MLSLLPNRSVSSHRFVLASVCVCMKLCCITSMCFSNHSQMIFILDVSYAKQCITYFKDVFLLTPHRSIFFLITVYKDNKIVFFLCSFRSILSPLLFAFVQHISKAHFCGWIYDQTLKNSFLMVVFSLAEVDRFSFLEHLHLCTNKDLNK